MDEHNLQVSPQGDADDVLYEPLPVDDRSAFDRFGEVFTSPASAFTGLPISPNRMSIILWGTVIGLVINLFSLGLWSASPELIRQTRDMQMAPLERAYDQGKMKKEQYDAMRDSFDDAYKEPFSVRNILSVAVVPLIGWVIAAAAVLVIGRSLGSSHEEGVSYATSFSLYMIAMMIPLVEKIITTIGMYLTGTIKFSLSAAALVNTDNQIVLTSLGFINPFTIWWIAVTGIGIAIAANASRTKSIAFWGAVHVFVMLAFAAIGQLVGVMFGG